MFINPKQAIIEQWITFPEWMDDKQREKCIQPNAIDFTLDQVRSIDSFSVFKISETEKIMRDTALLPSESGWALTKNYVYDGMSDFYINVPENVAAFLIIRSSFNRNGLFIQSGLYDSGYKGHIGFVIYNMGGVAYIDPHTRIGQVIFVKSENATMYAGGWNHEQGTHYTDKL
jgi:deoxycytidine triphosphate deaminase